MNTSGQTPPAPKFQVRLNWKLALFSLLLLPVLIGLGLWQLQRAEEKRTIQESWQRQQALPPVSLAEVEGGAQHLFRRVSVTGEFDSQHYWLLENRILHGNLGYEVLMPLRTGGASVVIVNRGWLPAGVYRSELPAVTTPSGEVSVSGTLVEPGQNRFIRNPSGQVKDWPVRVLQADVDLFAAQLASAGYKVEPYRHVLRLDAESAGAFEINWQPINMSPAKHTGYAVQWFSMAFVLLILAIFANTNLSEILFRNRQSE